MVKDSRYPIISFSACTSENNWHGPGSTTLTWTARIVQMDAHCQHWSLYLYHHKGRWVRLSVAFPRWRREWRP